ncbi:MAG: diguanylate cyclase [Acidimicrobiales bacterium]
MRFDPAQPTRFQARQRLVSVIIAVSVALPLLVTAVLLGGGATRWEWIDAAGCCVFVSVVYLALFAAVAPSRRDPDSQASAGFVLVCLSLATLGCIALSAPGESGTFLPGILVAVVFVGGLGPRWMRFGLDAYAIALVAAVSMADGLRGELAAAVIIVYASTIVLVTWVTARTVGSLTEHAAFRRAMSALNEAFDEIGQVAPDDGADLTREVLRRGLPLVTGVLPATRVVAFARSGRLGHFLRQAAWPEELLDPSDLADLPELAEALRADSVVLTDACCVIPIGLCSAGDLVMVVERASGNDRSDRQATEAAVFLAAAFLRATTRANVVSGLHIESRTDPLTGLPNRRTLFERIQIEMNRALRYETPLSIAMIDLDHFKGYNDRFGHVAGDTVLRAIAALMVSNIRAQDLVVRYGGEEFCLVMPDTDILGGHHLLDKLRTGGRDTTTDFGVTLSAGLTSWDGVEDATALIRRADEALYRAKETGRDRVVSIQLSSET